MSNAGTSGVSEARMKIVQEEDKKQLSFEEEHMVRLVSWSTGSIFTLQQAEKDAFVPLTSS